VLPRARAPGLIPGAMRLPAGPDTPAATLSLVRRALLWTYVFGAAGTAVELVLLEHYDDPWQWAPIVLLAASLLVLAWHAAPSGRRAGVRAFRWTMLLFVASGVVGTLLHYRGNVEFELEREPTLGGLRLFWEAIRGATPALAPGTMIQLALVGLAYTVRHPALTTRAEES
jgi:hypothetical protein